MSWVFSHGLTWVNPQWRWTHVTDKLSWSYQCGTHHYNTHLSSGSHSPHQKQPWNWFFLTCLAPTTSVPHQTTLPMHWYKPLYQSLEFSLLTSINHFLHACPAFPNPTKKQKPRGKKMLQIFVFSRLIGRTHFLKISTTFPFYMND